MAAQILLAHGVGTAIDLVDQPGVDGAPTLKVPPTEFLMFVFGPNATDQGEFVLDDDGCKRIMARFAERGIDLHGDWEHQSEQPIEKLPPKGAPASAWFKPAVRSSGLWASDVRWTPDAYAQIQRG